MNAFDEALRPGAWGWLMVGHHVGVMRRSSRLGAAVIAVGLIGLSACSGTGGSRYFSFRNANALGTVIPAAARKPVHSFSGSLITGGALSLPSDRHRVTVINFFASDCGPCRIETPQLALLAERDRSVQFIGVDLADQKPSALTFLKQSQVRYPVIFDPADRAPLSMDLPTRGVPFTVVLDRSQRVAAVYLGALTPRDLQRPISFLRKRP